MSVEMFLFIFDMVLAAALALYMNIKSSDNFFKGFSAAMLIFFFLMIVIASGWNFAHTFFLLGVK